VQQLFLYNIIKVLYSPLKAFKEILANPKLKGPIIIIIISLLLTLGTHYISASKHYVETITPTNRATWTNTTNPSSTWTSNAPPENVTATRATYEILVGNYSVMALLSQSNTIWLRNTNIGTVNCSQNSGFKTFYYKLMYVNLILQNASAAKLKLFSQKNETKYFEFNLLSAPGYVNRTLAWIDANVSLSDPGWIPVGGPEWSNITGIEFKLDFANTTKLTLQLNDLYFGGKYAPLFETVGFADWIALTLISSAFDLFIRWLILAGLLWLTIKVFSPEGSPFKTLLIIVGYSFAVTFVYLPIDVLSVSQLSTIYFPNKVVFPMSIREIQLASIATSNIYAANWTYTTPYLTFIFVAWFSQAWTISLSIIAVKILQNFSWKKAVAIGIVAGVMSIVLRMMVPL